MASNQKTSQQRRPKTTNCFLACFGFHPKTTNNTSSYKKKPKKFCARKKFFFKLSWPKKFKVVTIDNNSKTKKNFKFDANKTAVLKASHNIMLEATKVHHHQQLKMIDHHVSKPITTKEPILLLKGSTQDQDNQSRPSYRAICHVKDNDPPNTVVKQQQQQQQPLFADRVAKDSLIGASIMVAMLIIMSIWGRLCAILCMCGWLYCVPFLRGDKEVITSSNDTNTKMNLHKESMDLMASSNDTNTKIIDVDFNSELYKKKVVLDGLLQRDYHQNAIGIS